jgi:hypothetical protein
MFLILRTASSTSPLRTDGLPRRSLVLPPRNDKMRNFKDDLLPGGIR